VEVQEEIITSIASFALYGFPESHAASFALIAYASAYLKCHYLAAFTAALLNNQPMGFYSAATIVKDAQPHGLQVKPVDVLHSQWLCTLEPNPPYKRGREDSATAVTESSGSCLEYGKMDNLTCGTKRSPEDFAFCPPFERGFLREPAPSAGVSDAVSSPILRLGFRYVRGLRKGSADTLVCARAAGLFSSIEDLTRRVPDLSKSEWTMLAQVGALNGLGERFHRRERLWQVERAIRPAGALFKQSGQEETPSRCRK
jgi:error-prone DNA polymerase